MKTKQEIPFTTKKGLYVPLDVKGELRSVREMFKTYKISYNTNQEFFVPVDVTGYELNIVHYKKLLNIFNKTKVKDAYWRLCRLRGTIEIVFPGARYTINLK